MPHLVLAAGTAVTIPFARNCHSYIWKRTAPSHFFNIKTKWRPVFQNDFVPAETMDLSLLSICRYIPKYRYDRGSVRGYPYKLKQTDSKQRYHGYNAQQCPQSLSYPFTAHQKSPRFCKILHNHPFMGIIHFVSWFVNSFCNYSRMKFSIWIIVCMEGWKWNSVRFYGNF